MDKQTLSALISDLDGLKALLLEQSSANGTAGTSSPGADKMLKRIAKQCKQKLSACERVVSERRRTHGIATSSSSSDSGEDDDDVAAKKAAANAEDSSSSSVTSQPRPPVALKLRPLGELLKTVDTVRLDSSGSNDAGASTSANKSKSKRESNRAGASNGYVSTTSKSRAAGASTSAAATAARNSKSKTEFIGAGPSASSAKPKSQIESNRPATTIQTKRVQVTLKRLPDDLTSLLSSEGLHEELVVAQSSEVKQGPTRKQTQGIRTECVRWYSQYVFFLDGGEWRPKDKYEFFETEISQIRGWLGRRQ